MEDWPYCGDRFSSDSSRHLFDTRELRTADFALEVSKRPLTLVSLYETDSPIDLILSRRWVRFLEETSRTGRMALVARSERSLPHMESEFLLGLSHGSQFKAIH